MDLLSISAGLVGAATAIAAPQPQQYHIAWTDKSFPVARVEASLFAGDCIFSTADKWSDFFEGDAGWSHFIRDVSADDMTGHALPVTKLPKGRLKVGSALGPCRVKLRYSVDYSFGRQRWEAGNEQVAYTTKSAIYSTGLSLFLLGDEQPAVVTVVAPTDWVFATPWAANGPNSFEVPTRDALLNNTFVAGRTYAQKFTGDRFDLTIALLGFPPSAAEQIRLSFRRLAPRLVQMFGDHRHGRYMIALLRGPEDGESFDDSFAVSTEHPPSIENRIVWGNHLSHELIHYWIGSAIKPAPVEENSLKWFTEGFTEYFANRTLVDTGIYSAGDYRERMAHHMSNYLLTRQNPFFMNTTLRSAGDKAWSNRPLIYSGGAVLAFCLDSKIRKDSKGRNDLSTAMRELFEQSQSGDKLSDHSIISALSRADGSDIAGYYGSYVAGKDTLPLEQCSADAGLRALVHGYDVFLSARPSEAR